MTITANRQRKVRENVLAILEDHSETRNDDRLLMLKYWAEIDRIPYDSTFPVLFATRGTSPESITRARRQIQAAGLFPATDQDVQRKRRVRQEEMRQHFAGE